MIYRISAPATSANLGPGFDVMGIALDLYNRIDVSHASKREVTWEGEAMLPDDRNLVKIALDRTLDDLGHGDLGYKLVMREQSIPVSRGLGSSAASIVLGVLAADLLSGAGMSEEEKIHRSASFEGHPDNTTPCLLGGCTVSRMMPDRTLYLKLPLSSRYTFTALIPSTPLSTKQAREALPKQVPFTDAVSNLSSLALLLAAIHADRSDLIAEGLCDRLHEQYRRPLIEAYPSIEPYLTGDGIIGSFLSGAGPTVVLWCEKKPILRGLPSSIRVAHLSLDDAGARVEVIS